MRALAVIVGIVAAIAWIVAAMIVPDFSRAVLDSAGPNPQFGSGLRARLLQGDLLNYALVALVATIGAALLWRAGRPEQPAPHPSARSDWQPRPMGATPGHRTCTSCSAGIPPGARFCGQCGAPAPSASLASTSGSAPAGPGSTPSNATKTCGHCGATVDAWRMTCHACGHQFGSVRSSNPAETCMHCKTVGMMRQGICQSCGWDRLAQRIVPI